MSLRKVESSFMLAVASLMLALGFILGDGNNANYALMYGFADPIYWSVFFFSYSFVKFLGIWKCLDYRIRLTNSALGIWAWNYIFLSFAVFDKTPMAPTEILLMVPVIVEMWSAISVDNSKNKKE